MDSDRLKRILCNYINLFDYKGVDNLSYIIRQTLDLIQKQEKEIEQLKNLYSDEKIRSTIIKRYREVIEKDYIKKDKIRKVINKFILELEKEKEYRYTGDVEDEQEMLREVQKELLKE